MFNVKGLIVSDEEPVYPMMCELYNEKNCSNPNGCDFQVEMCESDTSCYTVWSTTGEVKMKGCFPDNQECNQKDCIANSPSPNGLLFCCCNEPLCNEGHEWVPLKDTFIFEEILEDVEDEFLFYVLVLGVVPSIFIILLVIIVSYVIYRRCSAKNGLDDLSTVSFCLAFERLFDIYYCDFLQIESALQRLSLDSSTFQVQLIEAKAKGRFGTVWLGKVCGEEVAVKISQDELTWKNESDIYNVSFRVFKLF